ncbi:type II toxin-antitoxin system PemK/MazF family toxin [Ornithinimicrobium cryptoxanthini]|uniref:type II toxin-antitoxin system PemK/MazF family toxin n=1 Tax=Ornithinimicrobium cryptoxanthini TaxID=2934161 RepID=UPI002118C5DE|nr:type II toxin-antitoxin system PemK/MazF family toxin [Ornithinimicrobium cryptoxanthini]
MPSGSEAGLRRPAIVVTARRILPGEPNVVQVVPLTRTVRHSSTEVVIDPDDGNRLAAPSSAQCQHVSAVATTRRPAGFRPRRHRERMSTRAACQRVVLPSP